MSHETIIFDAENHRYYVNGDEKPGVTTILKNAGLSPDFSLVDSETLEWKAQLGKEVHRVIELIIKNDLGDYDPILEPYIQAAKSFMSVFNIKPIRSELAVYSSSLGCCGTLDLLAHYNDTEEGIFDFKTSSAIDLMYVGPQTAGYDFSYREWSGQTGRKPYKRFAVQLLKTGKFKVIPCTNPDDLLVFRYACQSQDPNNPLHQFYEKQINSWKERFKNVNEASN